MDQKKYYKTVGNRLKNAMELRKMTQADLCYQCQEQGLDLSQPSLSRLLNGADKPEAIKVAVICKVLNLQLNEVLSLDLNANLDKYRSDSPIVTDTRDDRFKAYLGKYDGYFYSTLNNDVIHHGTFIFDSDPSTSECRVSFEFDTGNTDIQGEPVQKRFVGTAKLSAKLGAICCEMTAKDDDSGDVSYIIFKYHYIAHQKCECRIGMVVTIGAGFKRLPVAHKLLISRQKLSDEDLYFIAGQLKLNDDTLLVSDLDYRYFINDPLLPKSFKHLIEQDNDLFKKKAVESIYYSFREDDILDDKSLTSEDKVKTINLLRKYSNAKRCKKVGPKSEDYVFKYLMAKKDKQKEQGSSASKSSNNEQKNK